MIPERILKYRTRIQEELAAVYDGSQPPSAIAGSFAFGTFITALPSLGTGFIILAAAANRVTQVNIVALFAPVVVLNPLVKSGVYAMSFALGVILLGPVSGLTPSDISLTAGPSVATRLLVGNFLVAVVFALIGYYLVNRGVQRVRRRGPDPQA